MRKIEIRAANVKYKDVTFISCCPFDTINKKYISSQENLTPAELKKEPFIIDVEEFYPIMDRDILWIHSEEELKQGEAKTKDDVMYGYYKILPIMSLTVRPDPNKHLFYIYDVEGEAKTDIQKTEYLFEALKKVKEDMSIDRFKDLGIYLGLPVSSMSQSQIQAKVYDTCNNEPVKILEFFKPDNALRMLFRKFVHYGIITKKGGKHLDAESGMPIGDTEMDVIGWMLKKENEDRVGLFRNRLAKVEPKPTPPPDKAPTEKKRGFAVTDDTKEE